MSVTVSLTTKQVHFTEQKTALYTNHMQEWWDDFELNDKQRRCMVIPNETQSTYRRYFRRLLPELSPSVCPPAVRRVSVTCHWDPASFHSLLQTFNGLDGGFSIQKIWLTPSHEKRSVCVAAHVPSWRVSSSRQHFGWKRRMECKWREHVWEESSL